MRAKYHYKITIDPLHPTPEGQKPEQTLSFETYNHDNVLAVARRLCKKTHFDYKTATSFAVGLKLITEVMLENRDDPLFSELKPAMVHFMKKLKTQMRAPASAASQEISVQQQARAFVEPQNETLLANASGSSFESGALDDIPADNMPEEALPQEGDLGVGDMQSFGGALKEAPQDDEIPSEEFVVGDFSAQDTSIEEGDDVEEIVLDEGLASEFASDESLDEFLQNMENSTAQGLAQEDAHKAAQAKRPAQMDKRSEVKYALVEKVNEDGVLEGLELVEVEENT